MPNTIEGRARVYPRAHINTDEIIPARYLNVAEESELAKHAMEDIDPDFASTVEPGDIIVGGEDFGCGSSREHAVWALRGAGVGAVIAESFARIFFRNSVNNGFRSLECEGITDAVQEGDRVQIDLDAGVVRVPERGVELPFAHPGEFAERLIAAGGLMAYVAETIRGGAAADATATKADAEPGVGSR